MRSTYWAGWKTPNETQHDQRLLRLLGLFSILACLGSCDESKEKTKLKRGKEAIRLKPTLHLEPCGGNLKRVTTNTIHPTYSISYFVAFTTTYCSKRVNTPSSKINPTFSIHSLLWGPPTNRGLPRGDRAPAGPEAEGLLEALLGVGTGLVSASGLTVEIFDLWENSQVPVADDGSNHLWNSMT